MVVRSLLFALAVSPLPLVPLLLCGQDADLTPGSAAIGDQVGYSVSSDGLRVAVGAPDHDEKGAVFLYTRHGSSWTLEAELSPGSGQSGDRFGHAVSLSGGLLAVSALHDDTTSTDGGAVYVFRQTATGWTQQAKIAAPTIGTEFGESLALRGDTLAIGQKSRRQVWMYRLIAGGWVMESDANGGAVDFPGYFGIPIAASSFGDSVALEQDTLLVGDDDLVLSGTAFDKIGGAWVFRRTGSQWALAQTLVNPLQQTPAEHYGESVALDGPWAAVGAPRATAQGFTNAGVTHLFLLDASNQYQPHSTVEASDPLNGDAFGDAVALRGDQLVVGAPLRDAGSAFDGGAAYELTFDGQDWVETAIYDPGDQTQNEQLGLSVAIGSYSVLGGPSDLISGDPGRVVIWRPCGL